MTVSFVKLTGLGNDFIMVDNMDGQLDVAPEVVAAICDRHFGVGGDGVILVNPPKVEGHDAYMHYINSDGTLAQMCGNGIRCTARFLVSEGYLAPERGECIIDTLAGAKPIEYTCNDAGEFVEARVNMGQPILDPQLVPTTAEKNATVAGGPAAVNQKFILGDFEGKMTPVSMGNPHVIFFGEDPAEIELEKIGPKIEVCHVFPEKTNVEFVQVLAPNHLKMRVWERGCGETLACGTGACATAVAGVLAKGCERDVTVSLLGGDLRIEWPQDDSPVFMTGVATESFRGTLDENKYPFIHA